MLPEFPVAAEAIQRVWNRLLFDTAGFADPLISQVSVRVQREGHRAVLGETETQYQRMSVSHQFAPQDGAGMSTEEFFRTAVKLGTEIASKQATKVFDSISADTSGFGSLTKAEGPMTFQLWLKKMESFSIDFDDNGQPEWPQWFLSSEAFAEFKTFMAHELSPEQKAVFTDFVNRKRKEFDEREARRRLVE